MQLTPNQQNALLASGHLLVTGGPGSGKTTVAILKAARIAECALRPAQDVLFLSFARATVSRVIEAIEHEQRIQRETKSRIEVDTYHSFFWRILKAHGYLIGLPRRLSILTPPQEAIALSGIRRAHGVKSKLSDAQRTAKARQETLERRRLAYEDGRICFDLFADLVGELLDRSERIRRLIATRFPVVILDEFQDTNAAQWRVVRGLGQFISLVALADPEQRIYDFIGADPARLLHFRKAFHPIEIDLGSDNHRSAGTDIGHFGNDLLTGAFRGEGYKDVDCRLFEPYEDQALTALVTVVYKARRRLVESKKTGWTVAVLVPTKRMTRLVSGSLRVPPAGMKPVPHVAAIEYDAAILGAEIIAFMMQSRGDSKQFGKLVELVRNFYHGKGGDSPSLADLNEADRVLKAYEDCLARESAGKTIRSNSILVAMRTIYGAESQRVLTGDPDLDWRDVRDAMEKGDCLRLRDVAEESRDIRLLERGTHLRLALSEDWRANGTYAHALAITRDAFVREHFAAEHRPEAGVVVMNMHKAKGKQFDEVIIFEGWPRRAKGKIVANLDRIVRENLLSNCGAQTRQNLRVSVTRARRRTTILTPKGDPCVLLVD